MDTYYDAIKSGLAFIEAHLEDDLSVQSVASAVGYSQFHYSRIFSKSLRCSIYDYIMKRKLSSAYYDLLEPNRKIIDIAFKYNFGSHESFTRAFKKLFGVTPSNLTTKMSSKVYEAIDDDYLHYLHHLKISKKDILIDSAYFVGCPLKNSTEALNETSTILLVTNHTELPIEFQYIMIGKLKKAVPKVLHYKLTEMTHIATINSASLEHISRCLKEIILCDTLSHNYVLLQGCGELFDIYVPRL